MASCCLPTGTLCHHLFISFLSHLPISALSLPTSIWHFVPIFLYEEDISRGKCLIFHVFTWIVLGIFFFFWYVVLEKSIYQNIVCSSFISTFYFLHITLSVYLLIRKWHRDRIGVDVLSPNDNSHLTTHQTVMKDNRRLIVPNLSPRITLSHRRLMEGKIPLYWVTAWLVYLSKW